MKVWNYLCDEIAKDKSNNLKEDAFENRISMFFQSALYWSSINDELREQYPIEFAHTKGRADIVLLDNNHVEIIIELKKPNHVQDADNIRQLTDYMKIKRCPFGIYLGDKLELYFDEPDNSLEPKLISSINFTKDNIYGKELLNLIQRINYSADKLKEYCQKQLALQQAMNFWTSPNGKKEILDYIIKHSNLQESYIESLTKMIDIRITDLSKADTYTNGSKTTKKAKAHEAKPHDNMQYSLDNETFLSKRAFAFQVIKKITEDYPSITFDEISSLTHSKTIVRKKSDWEELSYDQKARYCDNDDEILEDANGVEFLVTDQWTKEKIEKKLIEICHHFQWKVYRK